MKRNGAKKKFKVAVVASPLFSELIFIHVKDICPTVNTRLNLLRLICQMKFLVSGIIGKGLRKTP